jgi:Tfp pilus assembly protein PilV
LGTSLQTAPHRVRARASTSVSSLSTKSHVKCTSQLSSGVKLTEFYIDYMKGIVGRYRLPTKSHKANSYRSSSGVGTRYLGKHSPTAQLMTLSCILLNEACWPRTINVSICKADSTTQTRCLATRSQTVLVRSDAVTQVNKHRRLFLSLPEL